MKRLSSPLVLSVLFLSGITSAFAGQINVTGEALVQVAPDEVQVSLGVEVFDKELDAAKRINDARSQALLKALKDLGIEEKHIQTDVLSVELKYRDNGAPSNGIEGYFVRRSYKVCLKEVKKFESVVDAALKAGVNHIVDIDFKSTELRKHRDAARLEAIKAAKEKAVALAGALDVKVGKPMQINEGYFSYESPYRPWWGNSYRNQFAYQTQNAMVNGGGATEGGGTLPMGMIGIRAQITVTFELE